MRQYLDLIKYVLTNGKEKDDRTNTGTISCFGYQMKFDLSEGYPLVTTKKVHFKSIVGELLWFISGSTNIKYLVDNGIRIWNEWPYEKYKNSPDFKGESIEEFAQKIKEDSLFAKKYGELGPVYGKQWRDFLGIDQFKNLISNIKTNPSSRRLILSAWNPVEVDKMLLPPCHCFFQFYVNDNKLSCQLYQRSGDIFLGIPFNIASYSLLTILLARECNLEPGTFVHTIGDCHIYKNHLEQVNTQLERTPRKLPTLKINTKNTNIFNYKIEDFELVGYDPYPLIKAKVAV